MATNNPFSEAERARHRISHFMAGCPVSSRRDFLSKLAGSAVASALSTPLALARTAPGSGRLHLTVFDQRSGQPMPARLHIQLADGSHWTPISASSGHHHAEAVPGLVTGYDFESMVAPARCSLLSTHLSRGEAILELPPGKCKIFLSRGFEYRPVQLSVDVAHDQTLRVEEPLERWIDMPAQGYFSGDIHQHFTRTSPADNELWEALARAEDLHLINTMVLKHGEPANRYEQYAYGRDGTHQSGHYVIVPGEEFRDNDMSGHMTMAGIQKVIEPVSTGPKLGLRENFPPFAVACREARRQGAVVGWAHGAVSGDWGGSRGMESVAVEAALGLIDFLEVVQFMSFLGETFWYRLLGSGLQLSGVGGTDFPFGIWLAPWYPSFGQERTFVKVAGDFTPQSWFEGVRKGQLFSSNGPMVWFSVEGKPAGTKLDLAGTRKLRVKASARCAYPLESLQILVNGRPVESAQPLDGDRRFLSFEGNIDLEESSWLAARATGTVTAETFGG